VSYGSSALAFKTKLSSSTSAAAPTAFSPPFSPQCDECFIAYINEAADAFNFMTTCTTELYEEVNRLDKELDTMMVRTQR
jgi:hypothetical protein